MSMNKLLDIPELRNEITAWIDGRKDEYIQVSHEIHDRPELGNEEVFASGRLSQLLKSEGFAVETGIAGHPNGFIARYASNHLSGATVGFLAEYDALPEIGHGCGHNIIGTASVAAAIALARVIDRTGGRVAVFGSPAEEGGANGSAKASYVKQGIFKDVDACLMMHPASVTTVTEETLALDPLDFEFFGKAAHAAACPEKGVNALDGVIQLFNGINALRQQLPTDVRIHGIITHGGVAPNIIPEYAKARFFIRAATRERCDEVTGKVRAIAQGAALATGTKVKIDFFQNPIDNFLTNQKLDAVFKDVIAGLGESIKPRLKKGLGSTDAGNVSHVVPTIQPSVRIGPDDLVAHSIEFSNAAKSKEGDRALIISAKALALTGLILLTDEERLQSVRAEFEKNSRNRK